MMMILKLTTRIKIVWITNKRISAHGDDDRGDDDDDDDNDDDNDGFE